MLQVATISPSKVLHTRMAWVGTCVTVSQNFKQVPKIKEATKKEKAKKGDACMDEYLLCIILLFQKKCFVLLLVIILIIKFNLNCVQNV